MDATIVDPVEGRAALVNGSGQLRVEAAVPSTVNVNVASQSGQVETTPGSASGVAWNQVDVDTTSGGVEIVAGHARTGLHVTNMDNAIVVFLGIGSNPTATSGYPLRPGETFTLPAGVTSSAQVKGITASGTARVAFFETT